MMSKKGTIIAAAVASAFILAACARAEPAAGSATMQSSNDGKAMQVSQNSCKGKKHCTKKKGNCCKGKNGKSGKSMNGSDKNMSQNDNQGASQN